MPGGRSSSRKSSVPHSTSPRNSRSAAASIAPRHTKLSAVGPVNASGAPSSSTIAMEIYRTPSAPTAGAPFALSRAPEIPRRAGIVGPFKSASTTPTALPPRARARPQIRRHIALPHAAFSTHPRYDSAPARQPLGHPAALGADLGGQPGTVGIGQLVVGAHGTEN